jgi:hypothetical protein
MIGEVIVARLYSIAVAKTNGAIAASLPGIGKASGGVEHQMCVWARSASFSGQPQKGHIGRRSIGDCQSGERAETTHEGARR